MRLLGNKMSDKQQILEPLASVAKIILLPFESDVTKIQIRSHGIHYDDPDTYTLAIFNSLKRTWKHDNRDDIAVLLDMLINYFDWYLINIPKESSREKFNKFAKLCIKGLEKLQHVYRKETSNAIPALQYYITLTKIILENPDKYKNNDEFKKFLPNIKKDNINMVDISSIKKIWTEDEIETVFTDIFACFDENLEKKTNEFTLDKVKGLIMLLDGKDAYFAKTIRKSLYGGSTGETDNVEAF